jgi:hypothetical protein
MVNAVLKVHIYDNALLFECYSLEITTCVFPPSSSLSRGYRTPPHTHRNNNNRSSGVIYSLRKEDNYAIHNQYSIACYTTP